MKNLKLYLNKLHADAEHCLTISTETEQITFTSCTFKDCNIESIDANEARGIISKDNKYERPLDDQRKDFEERLAAVLNKRVSKT